MIFAILLVANIKIKKSHSNHKTSDKTQIKGISTKAKVGNKALPTFPLEQWTRGFGFTVFIEYKWSVLLTMRSALLNRIELLIFRCCRWDTDNWSTDKRSTWHKNNNIFMTSLTPQLILMAKCIPDIRQTGQKFSTNINTLFMLLSHLGEYGCKWA